MKIIGQIVITSTSSIIPGVIDNSNTIVIYRPMWGGAKIAVIGFSVNLKSVTVIIVFSRELRQNAGRFSIFYSDR